MIHLVPCLQDNYSYVIECSSNKAIVIDPADAVPILRFLKNKNLRAGAIFNTHHHWDHIGGNAEIKRKYGCPVYGFHGDRERIALDVEVSDQEVFDFENHKFKVLHIPGHTLGHIAYAMDNETAVFCGDTLFSLGCGRLFEGTHEQMVQSLTKLSRLQPSCKIYCGHEYTLQNLRFAVSLNILDYHDVDIQLHSRLKSTGSTLPSTIDFEKNWNPFLRCFAASNPVTEFQRLRELKDHFH